MEKVLICWRKLWLRLMVQGENGTGKELVARELYRNSMLAKQPYIRVNCAAISETLMESEFSGMKRVHLLVLPNAEKRQL